MNSQECPFGYDLINKKKADLEKKLHIVDNKREEALISHEIEALKRILDELTEGLKINHYYVDFGHISSYVKINLNDNLLNKNQKSSICLFHLDKYNLPLDESYSNGKEFVEWLMEQNTQKDIEKLSVIGLYLTDLHLSDKEFLKPVDLRMLHVKGDFIIENCVFKDEVFLDFANFNGIVNFFNVTFEAPVYISSAIFGRNVEMSHVYFKSKVVFFGTKFLKDVYFQKVQFGSKNNLDRLNFDMVFFNRHVSMLNTNFNHYTTFEDTLFNSGCSIDDSQISGIFFFNNVNSNGNVEFKDIRFNDKACLVIGVNILNENSFVILDNLDDLGRVSFINQFREKGLSNIVIKNPKFKPIIKNVFLIDKFLYLKKKGKVKKDDIVHQDIEDYNDITLDNVLNVYRKLRKYFDEQMFYDISGKLFIDEMRLVKLERRWRERIFFEIYDLLAEYGENIVKPFLWSIFLITCIFPLVIGYEKQVDLVNNYTKLLWESIRNFFQLGDYNTWSSLAERLIAIPTLGAGFISLKRKFERRIK